MSDMTEKEIDTMAWQLEQKMMEIRKDPRAALTSGLARIRETMVAELEAYHAKKETEYKAHVAKKEAEYNAYIAKKEADIDAAFAAKLRTMEAKFDAAMAEVPVELRACLEDGIRLRRAVADSLRQDEKAGT